MGRTVRCNARCLRIEVSDGRQHTGRRMEPTTRRTFLRTSGGAALAARRGGIAAILASARAPAVAQQPLSITDYVVTTADHGRAIGVDGQSVRFNSAIEYGNGHSNVVVNADSGRMQTVSVADVGTFRLYPKQTMTVRKLGANWSIDHPGRWRLERSTDVFASTTGNTVNDGLAPDSPLPVSEALARIKNDFDINGKHVALRLADGRYRTLTHIAGHWAGSHNLEIHGNAEAPTNVQVAPVGRETGLYVTDYARVVVRHILFDGDDTSTLVLAEQQGTIGLANCTFRNGGTQVRSVNNGNVRLNAACTFKGTCTAVLSAYAKGRIELNASVYTIDGPMTFAYFAGSSLSSMIAVNPGASFVGAGAGIMSTGKKFLVAGVSSIDAGGGGIDFFPGNSAGTTDPTSHYGG
jgi:hypothetical protein